MKPIKLNKKMRSEIAHTTNTKLLPTSPRLSSGASSIRNTNELGLIVKETRQAQGLIQLDVIGIANVGNRFISELENGKPTLQIQKVLDVLDILGLEVVVRRKGAANV
jgi:HTH-type transcriptional regulator / antitoxin HipB